MSVTRQKNWSDLNHPDGHVALFLALDEALQGFLGKFGTAAIKTYKIITTGGTMERRSRDRISEALISLGGIPKEISVSYFEPLGLLKGDRKVNISMSRLDASSADCIFSVSGYDENSTNGLFHTLINQMEAEIKRRDFARTAIANASATANSNSGGPAIANAVANATSTSSSIAPVPASRKRGILGQLDAVLRHPTSSAIIAALVVFAIIGAWHLFTR